MARPQTIEFNEAIAPSSWPAVPEDHANHVVETLYECCFVCDHHQVACLPGVTQTECLTVDGHNVSPGLTFTIETSKGTMPDDCLIKGLSVKLP